MELKEEIINVNGVDTHYYMAGTDGSPVMLLHGGGADSAKLSWEDVILPLAESGHHVYAPDLPGYGKTDRPDVLYNTEYYLEFVADLLDKLCLYQTSLAGLSMGGCISLGTALKRPKRVNKLVLVDSYGIQRKVAAQFLSWLMVKTPGMMESTWALSRASKATSDWLLKSIFHNPKAIPDALFAEAYAEALLPHAGRAFTRYQRDEVFPSGLKTVYIDRLGELSMPVLILHGRQDTAVPLACAEEAHRRIAGSQLCVIDGAGHWPQREQPEAFVKALTAFLKD